MSEGRREKTVKNLIYAWMSQMVMLIMNIVVRMLFVRVLSAEYLGLGGLFGNIISLLSLAELGVGTAITYSLYEPLAYKNEEKIAALMNFYRRVYWVIGCAIFVAGVVLTPFLAFFIKEMPAIPEIKTIYLLFIINSAVSYFFSYKSALISADQCDYLTKKVKLVTSLGMYVVQLAVLYLTKNYCLFLGVQIGATCTQNVVCSKLADKKYPFLRRYNQAKIADESLYQIIKNTKALMFHKLGEVMVFSTDNLLISKFVGLVEVGLYSNYTLIQQALTSILAQVFSAMTASVGNLGVTESSEKKYEVFKKVFFLNAWIYGFCSISFLCLAQDFIALFFGAEYVMQIEIVLLIVLSFYLAGMRKTTLTFRDALGLFWHNRYMPICEAILNLFLSVIFVRKYGVGGVLLGTVISTVLLPWWIEPYIVFKHGMKLPVSEYWKEYLQYGAVTFCVGSVTWKFCEQVNFENPLFTLLVKGIVCVLAPNLLFLLCYARKSELKYYLEYGQRIKQKMVKKNIVHEIVDWIVAVIFAVSMGLAYTSSEYYEKIGRVAPFIVFAVLGVLFFNHIDWKNRLKQRDWELYLLIGIIAVAVVNLRLAQSGFGAIFNLTNFLLVLYLANKVELNHWIHLFIGVVCLGVIVFWIGKGDNGYNTNLGGKILFAMAAYGTTVFTSVLVNNKKENWGKYITLVFILMIIFPMVLSLRARCVLIGIVVYIFINHLLPKKLWRCQRLYQSAVILLLILTFVFPIIYIFLWKEGARINFEILGKRVFSGRNRVWEQYLLAYMREPFTGIGSNFGEKIPELINTEIHNSLLHILVVHGAFVCISTLTLLVKRLWELGDKAITRKYLRQNVAFIVALMMTSIFENYFVFSFYNVLFLLLICIGNERNVHVDDKVEYKEENNDNYIID